MELNRKNMQKIVLLIAFTILLYLGLQNLSSVLQALAALLGLLSPFIIGLFIAFILNVPLRLFENRVFACLFRKRASGGARLWEKARRPVCIVLSIATVTALLCFILFLVIPEMARAFTGVARAIPGLAAQLESYLLSLGLDYQTGLDAISRIDWNKMISSAMEFLKNGAAGFLSATYNITSSIFSGVLNFILGFIFSLYILTQKEKLTRQIKQILCACLPARPAARIIEIGALSNRIFCSFINGQLVEAVIIGVLCLAGMSVLRIPYALTISVLVGFTALIPVFGAFIGTAVGALLIVTVSPVKALVFILFILILQQLEGNLIYPHVVGTSVGLPGIWVMVAVTLGGSTFGVLGMLVGVPLCSVIYSIVREETIKELSRKEIPPVWWQGR